MLVLQFPSSGGVHQTGADLYLHERLDKELENAKVAKITGELDAAARRKVFRAFAPIAQRVTQLPRELYDLLVATDAISEGENLQDAEMVINYDLSWTPLRLIQRVGRINRFTAKTHKIDVRNFFPGTEPYEHIVKLRSRLRDRGERVRELSDVDYLEDGVQTPVWLATRSAAAVAKLYEAKRRVLTWAELVETASEMPSTEVPAHLWRASPASRRQARQLPDGVQGCGYGRHPGLYLLLDVNGRRIGLFRDDRAHAAIRCAPQPQSHEELLALVLDVTLGEVEVDALEFDRAIGELVQRWVGRPGADQASADVSVLAALEVREDPTSCSK
ncbi:C-terminal helicase domain-containing protein [Enhygromyxa salina]|uniref:ATP-dependent RNA helicase DbpA n=1 Tax=Enhygromyxa salina TaxID=215803 RepID=A0A2S9XGY2_9BACT|nr:helicase-related protein [Enhygromyxa salina]PRP92115.1 ATP-dependent RNA helicase DbpA [Enhygromyxa salina]